MSASNTASVLPDLPTDIDDYLQETEASYPDIKPDTEKKIIWHDPQKWRTRFSLVYLHGFSASRHELSPVCEILAQRLQANLFLTRLSGHGRTPSAMAEASIADWQQDALEALHIGTKIGEQVIVIGNSTGGTLATWLALNNSHDVYAYILISPNFGLRSKLANIFFWPCSRLLISLFFGDTWRMTDASVEQEKYWTTSYPVLALAPMLRLVKDVCKSDISQIKRPVCVLLCPDDRIVDAGMTKKFYLRLQTIYKRMIFISTTADPQRHVLAGSVFCPDNTDLVVTEIYRFLTEELALL